MNGTNGGKEDGVASKVWRRCNRLFGPDAGVGNKSSVTEPPATGSGPGKEPPKKKTKKNSTKKKKKKKIKWLIKSLIEEPVGSANAGNHWQQWVLICRVLTIVCIDVDG